MRHGAEPVPEALRARGREHYFARLRRNVDLGARGVVHRDPVQRAPGIESSGHRPLIAHYRRQQFASRVRVGLRDRHCLLALDSAASLAGARGNYCTRAVPIDHSIDRLAEQHLEPQLARIALEFEIGKEPVRIEPHLAPVDRLQCALALLGLRFRIADVRHDEPGSEPDHEQQAREDAEPAMDDVEPVPDDSPDRHAEWADISGSDSAPAAPRCAAGRESTPNSYRRPRRTLPSVTLRSDAVSASCGVGAQSTPASSTV